MLFYSSLVNDALAKLIVTKILNLKSKQPKNTGAQPDGLHRYSYGKS